MHDCSKLKFDYNIRKPMVRCSIVNMKSGNLLAKSDPDRQVVLNFEPSNVDFIQPIISKGCLFKLSE